MNTTQIDYFIELFHTLNYSKAAENLGISQPTLSKAIRHLESDAGFTLFKKEGRQIIPTEQAKYFYPLAKQSMDLLNQAIEAAHRQKNVLSIGCISSVQFDYLPQLVEQYSKHTHSQFNISIDTSPKLIDALLKHEIEIAICTPPENNPAISSFPVLRQDLMVCLPINHRYAKKKMITMEMIKNEPLIAHNHASGMHTIVKSIYDTYDYYPPIVAEAEEDNSIIALVKRNLGIAILTDSTSLIKDGIVLVPLSQDVVERHVHICYRKEDSQIQTFIQWVKKNNIQ